MTSSGISRLLERLGFRTGSIVETIVTTINPDNSVNPAPMGITRRGSTLEVKPFKNSQTYRNLTFNPDACINITSDPSLYLQTAFKEHSFNGFHQPRFNGLRLMQADAHILVLKTKQMILDDLRASFLFKVKGIECKEVNPRAFSRGDAAAIEAVIHATRVKAFTSQGKIDEAKESRSRYYYCRDVVNRVTDSRILVELDRLVSKWSENL